VGPVCREKTQKAKAQSDLKPASVVPGNKGFFKYVHGKRSSTQTYKKGVREDPGNYTPVSLISVPRKIMEKI